MHSDLALALPEHRQLGVTPAPHSPLPHRHIPGRSLAEDLPAHIPALRRYARSLCRDAEAADDVVQEALLRAIANIRSFTPGTNLRAWLFTIARNTFLNGVRRGKNEVSWGDDGEAALSRLASKAPQPHALELTRLDALFQRLPRSMRETLLLVAVEGLSYEQAAAVMNVPLGTIRSRLSRARSNLLRMQEGVGVGD